MFPEPFIRRIQSQTYIDHKDLVNALEDVSPVSIRVNPAKWGRAPLAAEPVPWCERGYYLGAKPSFTFDPLFHAGCYYPQEASSMFLEQVFIHTAGNHENIKVLDLCGAPGGKSTHLASLIGEGGFLVANETIRSRADILAENLTRWGLSNSIVTQSDPKSFSSLPDFFDLLLVDAPCSGEGMFRDDVAVKEWSEENAALCCQRQRRILMDAWPSLREDGIMIYSTCTFNPGENEENIKWLTGSGKAESVRLDISVFPGIAEIDYDGIFGYGFYPGRIRGEGLFIAVLRKKGGQEQISSVQNKYYIQKIGREEAAIASGWTEFSPERFIRHGNEIFAAPCSHDELKVLLKALRIVCPGTAVCTVKGKDFIPSHEIAMSVRLKKNQFPSVDLDHSIALSYLRRDNFKAPFSERGWNLLTYNGINLGFVNNIGSRFNNYYPVEWRIRMRKTGDTPESIIKWISTKK